MGISYEEIRKYYADLETREQGYIVKIQKLMQEVAELKDKEKRFILVKRI